MIRKSLDFAFILFTGSLFGFFVGEQFSFYKLSKEPEKSVFILIMTKCSRNIDFTKNAKELWSKKLAACWNEEYSTIQDKAVKITTIHKLDSDIEKCKVKNKSIEECYYDSLPMDKKRRDKYQEYKELMK